jgi:hypothetical protein
MSFPFPLHQVSWPRFNTWNCVYWMCALDCGVPEVHALIRHWPLPLNVSSNNKICKRAIQHTFQYLVELFYIMHGRPEGHAGITSIPTVGKTNYEFILEDRVTGDLCTVYCYTGLGCINMSVEQRDPTISSLMTLGFTYPTFWLTDTSKGPMGMRLVRFHARELGDSRRPAEILHSQALSYFRYRDEIRRSLVDFMALAPEYWKNRGPLPDVLEL